MYIRREVTYHTFVRDFTAYGVSLTLLMVADGVAEPRCSYDLSVTVHKNGVF